MDKVPDGYFYSKNPKAFIVHETGHGLAFQNQRDRQALQEIYNRYHASWQTTKRLSEFSWEDYREMTAEAFTAFYFEDQPALESAGLTDLIPIFKGWIKNDR